MAAVATALGRSPLLRDHLALCNTYRPANLHGFRRGYDFPAMCWAAPQAGYAGMRTGRDS